MSRQRYSSGNAGGGSGDARPLSWRVRECQQFDSMLSAVEAGSGGGDDAPPPSWRRRFRGPRRKSVLFANVFFLLERRRCFFAPAMVGRLPGRRADAES